MSHATFTNESCHTYERVMSHIWRSRGSWMSHELWMSHVTHMNESHYPPPKSTPQQVLHCKSVCEGVMSHTSMSHVSHMHVPCHIYAWVMSHTWMSNVIHIKVCRHVSFSIYYKWMNRVMHMDMSWHICTCLKKKNSSTCVKSVCETCGKSVCETWHMRVCDITSCHIHNTCRQALLDLCEHCVSGMTHSCMWHDSFMSHIWPLSKKRWLICVNNV